MPVMVERLQLLNLWVDAVSMEQAVTLVKQFVETGDKPQAIFAVNPPKNFYVREDPALWRTFKEAALLIPDGIGIVLGIWILHGRRLSRIPGVELMEEICKLAAKDGYKVFVYGAKEDVNKIAADNLIKLYPGLNIVGRSNGYVKEEEMPELIAKINKSQAEILFLALGSPKQEKWFATHKSQLTSVRVCQGLGGSIDVVTGTVKRAPEIWQKFGLEWVYRVLDEPKKFKRLRFFPPFLMSLLKTKFRICLRIKN